MANKFIFLIKFKFSDLQPESVVTFEDIYLKNFLTFFFLLKEDGTIDGKGHAPQYGLNLSILQKSEGKNGTLFYM